ncbi:aldose 1-epimerase [Robiginitalea sp. SC105]|uniref:aldose epimerase family protein n=1 Tax=Robiginitalea sp. SC105 TaxID=2762332 RepID=UPI00163B2E34|nr:aldose 1-epimerase [Robiginitalea sp. SC105]MBC2839696.1 aldose 1-epimerase [Robiginitalea sp. SC105]
MEKDSQAITELINGDLAAEVVAGELRSFRRGPVEYMHHPSEPGWGHTDTEMFPVIGPTAAAAYRVQVPRGNAIQDQHGLLRELPYTRKSVSPTQASFVKEYKAGTPVPNSKYPDRSTARLLIWPFDFQVEKHFTLEPGALRITFRIRGERDMPFMFGYHPAFRAAGGKTTLDACGALVGLEKIQAAGDRAFPIPDCESVVLKGESGIQIRTAGFGHFMCWSPDPGMVCVEPITYYPYASGAARLHEGFRYLEGDPAEFSVCLEPVALP